MCNQAFVRHALAAGPARQGTHLLCGVQAADIVPASKLRDIAEQVCKAHLVVHADKAALEQRPVGFDAVEMPFSSHELAYAVAQGLMVRESPVGGVFVGVDQRILPDPLLEKALSRVPVPDSGHRDLAHGAATGALLVLGVLVGLLVAHD